jgi:hypothetical protein
MFEVPRNLDSFRVETFHFSPFTFHSFAATSHLSLLTMR